MKRNNALWESQWGNRIIYANGDSNARGVAMLFSKANFKMIEEIRRDTEGHFLLVKMRIHEYSYCLANVYAPNVNSAHFFRELFVLIKQMNCVHTIIGGDFNLVMDPQLDRSKDIMYNEEAQMMVKSFMEAEEICDVWRSMHNEQKIFTWSWFNSKTKTLSWSCTDMFLTLVSMMPSVVKCEVLPSILSDHSLLLMEFDMGIQHRGPGIWKLNDEWLDCEDYTDMILKGFESVSKTFGYLNDTPYWDMMKFELANISKEYALKKGQKVKIHEYELYQILSNMQEEQLNFPQNLPEMDQYLKVWVDLDSILEHRAKRSMFRSRCKFWEEGGKASAYFLNMEKRNYLKKSMYSVRKKDGSITKDYREILNVQKEYYEELYTKDCQVRFNLMNVSGMVIEEEDKNTLDLPVSEDELFDGLMTLKPGKTPGCDGLTQRFYRKFWKQLVKPLSKMLKMAVDMGELSPSCR